MVGHEERYNIYINLCVLQVNFKITSFLFHFFVRSILCKYFFFYKNKKQERNALTKLFTLERVSKVYSGKNHDS